MTPDDLHKAIAHVNNIAEQLFKDGKYIQFKLGPPPYWMGTERPAPQVHVIVLDKPPTIKKCKECERPINETSIDATWFRPIY